jgi:hypothetical protein
MVNKVSALLLAVAFLVLPQPDTMPETTVCVEDMACWNCTTMGNLICGPDVDYPVEDIEPDTGSFIGGFN